MVYIVVFIVIVIFLASLNGDKTEPNTKPTENDSDLVEFATSGATHSQSVDSALVVSTIPVTQAESPKTMPLGLDNSTAAENWEQDPRFVESLHLLLASVPVRLERKAYFAENATIAIYSAAMVNHPMRPDKYGEYFKDWIRRIPTPLMESAKQTLATIEQRQREVDAEHSKKEKLLRDEQLAAVLASNEERIARFFEIAFRKQTRLDEYGDENAGAFAEELPTILKKMASTNPRLASEVHALRNDEQWSRLGSRPFDDGSISQPLVQSLRERFAAFCAERRASAVGGSPDVHEMTGVEFERHIMSLLSTVGATNIAGTPASGDQGADVLFSFGEKRVVVQAKRYSDTVGNWAVQEVHAAKAFYKADHAWVVTNSLFSQSARELARSTDVYLIDGSDLQRFPSAFNEFFGAHRRV